jgi:ubiquinol-cytochrome c reductase cytochrome b subunit
MLLGILACFTGYVVVFGQMSFWALIVILNLCTVIPVLDIIIINTILAGSYISDYTVIRIIELHFIIVILLLCFISTFIFYPSFKAKHFLLLLRISAIIGDIVTIKESIFIAIVFSILFLRTLLILIHPDNFMTFTALVTPSHIEPEVYFLIFFSLIKTRVLKLVEIVLWNSCSSIDVFWPLLSYVVCR